MSKVRVVEASKVAPTYPSFEDFLRHVQGSQQKGLGWVDGGFYELWPGGRCIRWTKLLYQYRALEMELAAPPQPKQGE